MTQYPVLERRLGDNPWKAATVGERRHRVVPEAPLPPGQRPMQPLPDPSDWTFELIERYHSAIAATAERFGLDTYPNQLEIITAEQMMDAYASVGMPVNYRHWSYGKEFLATERRYRRGHMGLAYEIVINSNPCIAYLMEENTTAMQALVIAHAAYGHNSFFKGNYLFRQWTNADAIVDYLLFAKNYLTECEERYGEEEVELLLDSCHALMNVGVDRYKRPAKLSMDKEITRQRERAEYLQSQVNDLWRTLPAQQSRSHAVEESRRFPPEPQENLLYFIEKNAPLLEPWQREITCTTGKHCRNRCFILTGHNNRRRFIDRTYITAPPRVNQVVVFAVGCYYRAWRIDAVANVAKVSAHNPRTGGYKV